MIAFLFGALFSHGEKIFAKEQTATVMLPSFNITINGHKIDNEYWKYPFIVYKNITYFPMTWYDSRLLGLEATWSKETGLEIKKSKVTSSYEPYRTNQKNAKSYQAKVMQGTVKLNEMIIDNRDQNYSFLIYNDIISINI